jgi:HPt (histidine-containing phosphotransfer) domain-containing protein
VLVGLYEEPERPSNAVDYIKRYMGAPTNVDVEAIKAENESLKKQIKELKDTLEELQKQVRNTPDWRQPASAARHGCSPLCGVLCVRQVQKYTEEA